MIKCNQQEMCDAHVGHISLAHVGWTLTFTTANSNPLSLPRCAQRHNDQEARSRFLHIHAPMSPVRFSSISGGNLQPETGWFQTLRAADLKWFVGCRSINPSICLLLSREFLLNSHFFLKRILFRVSSGIAADPQLFSSLNLDLCFYFTQCCLNQNLHHNWGA